ncbi:CMRF35-like molecule 3 isoform X2 [Channa argus]|uniref:CMRF35-like molecule 3 isoform X2 n=1 Tax=Channa argus TaxID=215402 RepID=UPI003521ADF1
MKNTFSVFFLILYAPWTAEANINIEGFEGGEVTFICAHRFARRNLKYFCKNECKSKDDILVTVKYGGTTLSGKIMLVDLKDGSFIVNIRELQLSDAGRYWCAVDRPGFDTFTAVNLAVKKEKDLKTYSITVSNTAANETPPVPSDASPTWTYQNIINTTQLIFEMVTSGPTNVSTTSNCTSRGEANFSRSAAFYAIVAASILIILVFATSFRKCREILNPQPQLCSNNSDLVNANERQVDRTSESAGAEAFPCPVYENISRDAHSRHSAANVQNDNDIRIYIKPLPPAEFERTDKHVSNFAGNGKGHNCATSASDTRSASCCDSTDSRGKSLWFGLDISGTI